MAEHIVEHVHDPVGDVIDRAVAGLRHDARRLGERDALIGAADEAELGHGREHDFCPLFGGIEVAVGCQPRRRLDQSGEHCRFADVDLARRLAEITQRRLLDAVGAGTEIDPVQIQFENLRLGEFALQPERQHHLLQLAGDGTLLSQKEIFGQLLRDGGAALGHAAVQNVGDQSACDAERIDAVMLVEAPILDGDEGPRNVIRQFLQRQDFAGEIAAPRQRAAGHVVDLDRGRALGDFQRLDRRQMRADISHGAGAADRDPQAEHQAPINQPAGQRAFGFAFAGFARAPARRSRCGVARGAAVGRGHAQVGAVVEHRLPPRA